LKEGIRLDKHPTPFLSEDKTKYQWATRPGKAILVPEEVLIEAKTKKDEKRIYGLSSL